MNVEDAELRQAISVAESYRQRVESLSRQVQVLRVSLDEVTLRSGVSKSVVEMLKSVGATGDMPDTAQLSLF